MSVVWTTMVRLVALVALVAALSEPVAAFPEDWQRVDARGKFSVSLPELWELKERQGMDGYVGEITGDGVRLIFDHGAYSNRLPYEQDPRYVVTYEMLGGKLGKLVRPAVGGQGTTGVYFAVCKTLEPRYFRDVRLTIAGEDLPGAQRETILAVLRSARCN